jgi:hypothetical protein
MISFVNVMTDAAEFRHPARRAIRAGLAVLT